MTQERKTSISTPKAPAAIGPYSQAIRSNGLLFISGQIPIDPESGELIKGDAGEQAERVLKNLQAILEAAGMGLEDVVKTTLYLKSLGNFEKVNSIYKRYFPNNPPARSTVEVSRLPKDAEIEIEAIACSTG
jgi:2-iminobutanoate/2-iminopropanoate deaminase